LRVVFGHSVKEFNDTSFPCHRLCAVESLFPFKKVIVNFKFD
jgi:hypothetical protein